MFFFGFFMGAAATVWFIVRDGGDSLIRLGGRLNAAGRTFREWLDRGEHYGA